MTGVLIVFEGCEGSGKSTQARLLAARLRSWRLNVVETREPGATQLGSEIRRLLLGPDGEPPTARTEALLYAADRAQHVETVIEPALRAGVVVVCDRYISSSVAYQGEGRNLGRGEVASLSAWATAELLPDLTVLLDIDPKVGLERAGRRGIAADRLELEPELFHRRVRESFLWQANLDPQHWLVLDAADSVEDLAEQVARAVDELLVPAGLAEPSMEGRG
jgi:dTMP kinase